MYTRVQACLHDDDAVKEKAQLGGVTEDCHLNELLQQLSAVVEQISPPDVNVVGNNGMTCLLITPVQWRN